MSDFRIHGVIDAQNRQFLAKLAESRAALSAIGKEHRTVQRDARAHAVQERELTRALQDQRRSLAALTGQYVNLRRAMLTLGVRTAVVGFNALAASISAVVNAMVMLTSSLSAAGAGLATFAASGLAAVAQGAIVAQLALKGIGKALTTTGTAHEKAMAKLTKPAREFVHQLMDMQVAFREIKLLAQQGLFEGVVKGVEKAKRALTPLKHVVYDTAVVLGDLADKLGGLIGRRTKDIYDLLERNVVTLRRFGDSAINIADGMISVFKAADPLIGHITRGMVTITKKFAEWADSQRGKRGLGHFFDAARESMDAWLHTVKDLGIVLFNVLKAAFGPAMQMQGAINGTLDAWVKWTGSDTGQRKMRDFFRSSLGPLGEMAKLMGAIAQSWVRLSIEGAPYAERFFSGLRTKLVPLLEKVFSTLDGQIFTRLMHIGGRVADFIGEGVDALKPWLPQLQKVGDALNTVLGLISSIVGKIPGFAKLPAMLAIGAVVLGTWRKLVDTMRLAVLQLRAFAGLTREVQLPAGAYRSIWTRGGRLDEPMGGAGAAAGAMAAGGMLGRGGRGGGGGGRAGATRPGGLYGGPSVFEAGRGGIYGSFLPRGRTIPGEGIGAVLRRDAAGRLRQRGNAAFGSHGQGYVEQHKFGITGPGLKGETPGWASREQVRALRAKGYELVPITGRGGEQLRRVRGGVTHTEYGDRVSGTGRMRSSMGGPVPRAQMMLDANRQAIGPLHFDRTTGKGLIAGGLRAQMAETFVSAAKTAAPRVAGAFKLGLGAAAVSGVISGLASRAPGFKGRAQDAVSGATFGLAPSWAEKEAGYTRKLAKGIEAGRYGGFDTKSGFNAIDIKAGMVAGKRVGVQGAIDEYRKLIDIYKKGGDIGEESAQKLQRALDQVSGATRRAGGSAKAAFAGLDFSLKGSLPEITETAEGYEYLRKSMAKLASSGGDSLKSIKEATKDAMAEARSAMVRDPAAGQAALTKNFQLARDAIKSSMDAGLISVKTGMAEIRKLMIAELKTYGLSEKQARSVVKTGTINSSNARGNEGSGDRVTRAGGGFIGTPGEKGRDVVPALLGRGEAVVNRHQQRIINAGLQQIGVGGGLPELFSKESTPHYFARGGYAGGGNENRAAAVPGRGAGIVALGHWLQSQGVRVSENPAFGGVTPVHAHYGAADHYHGGAIDANADGAPGGEARVFDRLAPQLARAGWHVLWRVKDHFDHMHVDIGGGGGQIGVGQGGGAAAIAAAVKPWRKIKAPRIKATGTLGQIGQAALDRVAKAANTRGAELAGTAGGGGGQTSAGGTYDKSMLKDLWVRAGGSPSMANLMAAIALAESGGRPGIINSIGAGGLWQIYPPEPNYTDPMTNARIAVRKLKTQGLGAWEAYTKGMHVKYLARGGGDVTAEAAKRRGTLPTVNAGDAIPTGTRGDRDSSGHKKKKRKGKKGKRYAGRVPFPRLGGIKPKHKRPHPHTPRINSVIKNIQGFADAGLFEPQLPDLGQMFDDPIDALTSTIGSTASGFELTDEQPTVTLFDGDPAAGGLPDLSNFLKAHPDAMRGTKSIDDFMEKYGNGLELPNIDGDHGFSVQGQLVRGIPEHLAEVRAMLALHTDSADGTGFGGLLGQLINYRDMIAGPRVSGELFGKRHLLDQQAKYVKKMWFHYHRLREDDAEELQQLSRGGISWNDRISINDQKISKLRDFLSDIKDSQTGGGRLTTHMKEQRNRAQRMIRELGEENSNLRDLQPPVQFGGRPQKPTRGKKEKKGAYEARLDRWRHEAALWDARTAERRHKIQVLGQHVEGWNNNLSFINGSTTTWQARPSDGVAGTIQNSMDAVDEKIQTYSDQRKQLVRNDIPAEQSAIATLIKEMNDWASTTVTPPPAQKDSAPDASTTDTDALMAQQRDDALRNLALVTEQLKVFQQFAPMAAGRLVGQFAHGGVIPETGMALVHKNERILPDPDGPFRTNGNAMMNPSINATTELHLHGELGALARLVDARVDSRAAKIVSEQLGRRSRVIASAPGR